MGMHPLHFFPPTLASSDTPKSQKPGQQKSPDKWRGRSWVLIALTTNPYRDPQIPDEYAALANVPCHWQSRPEYRRFIAATPLYAIWDDHDFTTNDGQGGPEISLPEWKIPVWQTFMNNWVNPYYAGGTDDQPGCWFDFSIADVDFFMLDGRYYRMDPRKNEKPSMLGAAQKKWLFDKLKASTGTFKILASPVPWAFGVKPGSKDPWQGFKAEREEIFSFLEAEKIDGVILLSADRHRSDARAIERENGYALYEFESSKLTNIHTHALIGGAIFGYNKKCSVGLLTFDTTLTDPQITYEIVNIDNDLIHTLTLKKSMLFRQR